MTVYVDRAIHLWRGRKWCHLFSTDIAELHEFARRLGLSSDWFQSPPSASWPHYDITASKRVDAVRMGAVEAEPWTTSLVSAEAMVEWCKVHAPERLEVESARLEHKRQRLSHGPARAAPPKPAQADLFG